jgi:hypothetical protein
VTEPCAAAGSIRSPVWQCQAIVLAADPDAVGRSLSAFDADNPAAPSASRDDPEPGVDQPAADDEAAAGSVVTLQVPRTGRLAERPHLGSEIDAFARGAGDGLVFPQSAQLPEVTRLYLSLLARIAMLMGGSLWLFGWLLERRLPVLDAVDAGDRSLRFRPDVWRSRGILWITIGLVFSALNILVIERLIGSLGLA